MAFPTSSHTLLAPLLVIMMLTSFHGGVSASVHMPAPAPGAASTDCFTELLSMWDCLSYVKEGSNMTKPNKDCCPELGTLVKKNPKCLCYLFDKNATSSYGLNIDLDRALDLPTVCKVDAPLASTCALDSATPVEAPGSSKANSPVGSLKAPHQGPSPSPRGNVGASSPPPVSHNAPAPSPEGASIDCFTQLLTMSDCLTYVEDGSNMTKPDKACCPELFSLVSSNPICLCYLFQKNSTSSYGFEIDLNKALELPAVCKVDTPVVSTCALAGIPVEVPMASQADSPAAGLENAPSEAHSASPSGNAATSSAAISLMPASFSLLAIVSSLSVFL